MYRMFLPAALLALLFFVDAHPVQAQTSVFQETFDGVTEPDLPATVLSADASWTTSSSSESTGSGGNNLRHGGTAPGDVVFGPIDLLNASSAQITYLARRTSSYPADSLVLSVSVDDGASWTMLMGPGAALPEATSEYESVTAAVPDSIVAGAVIHLRFRGYGGTSSGSNIRLDDITISAEVDLSDVSDTFGFQAGSSTSDGSLHSLPLDLAWTGPDSIQGIQFDVDFDESILSMTGVSAGSPVTGPGWTLDYAASAGSARVILLGSVGDVVSSGLHPGILTLEFTPNAGAASGSVTTITIRDLLVSAHDPGGSDLTVVAAPNEHRLTFELAQPSIVLSADSLGLGPAAVGSVVSGIVTVSNPSGEGDLVVSDVTTDSELYTADPTNFSVPPGGAVDIELTYAPTATDFGFRTGFVTLLHNADAGSSRIAVSATGTGGRGDVTNDGLVDVGDVVAGIDAVLGRSDPLPAAMTIDVHPFPAGNGSVDIRDLTVLVHAVLNGIWPDDVALPDAGEGNPAPGKGGRPAIVLSDDESSGTVLTVDAGVSLRGIQVVLRGVFAEPDVIVADRNGNAISGIERDNASFMRSAHEPASGRFVLVGASSGAVTDAGGRLEIRGLPTEFGPEDVSSAVGITDGLERLSLSVTDRRQTGTDTPESPLLTLSVFPNPAQSGHPATVRIQSKETGSETRTATWRIQIVDLLGRELMTREFVRKDSEFDLDTSRLPPGIYFVRGASGRTVRTIPLTIVR